MKLADVFHRLAVRFSEDYRLDAARDAVISGNREALAKLLESMTQAEKNVQLTNAILAGQQLITQDLLNAGADPGPRIYQAWRIARENNDQAMLSILRKHQQTQAPG